MRWWLFLDTFRVLLAHYIAGRSQYQHWQKPLIVSNKTGQYINNRAVVVPLGLRNGL